jgi:hypothetical protein
MKVGEKQWVARGTQTTSLSWACPELPKDEDPSKSVMPSWDKKEVTGIVTTILGTARRRTH